MKTDERWQNAMGHMSGHFSDPGAGVRERAAESTGFKMGQDLQASRAELARNGGPETIVASAVKRADAQMQASEAGASELTRQAAILKQKLRSGGGQ